MMFTRIVNFTLCHEELDEDDDDEEEEEEEEQDLLNN